MAQDQGLCREKEGKSINGPVHGPPLQARVAAANGTVFAACKLLALSENKPPALTNGDPGAHGMNRVQAKHKQNGMDGGNANLTGARC